MKKKRALIILCVVALVACALAFGRRREPAARASQQQASVVPPQVLYRHLFHHVTALKQKADEFEKDGKDATQFRTHFQRKANLTDDQARALEELAVSFNQEETLLIARAKPIIEAYKAQYPGGQVPHGQKPAPPPAELHALSQERDALALRARDQLRARLGDQEFNRFESFLRTRIAPNVQAAGPQ